MSPWTMLLFIKSYDFSNDPSATLAVHLYNSSQCLQLTFIKVDKKLKKEKKKEREILC